MYGLSGWDEDYVILSHKYQTQGYYYGFDCQGKNFGFGLFCYNLFWWNSSFFKGIVKKWMNPQDKTRALTTPVVSIRFNWWKAFIWIILLKLDDDNLCKYVVQRDAYKTSMLCLEPKPTPILGVCRA